MTGSSLREHWATRLGSAVEKLTAEQLDHLDAASRKIRTRWPRPADEDSRRRALTSALAVIVGDDTLESVAALYHRAARERDERHAAFTGAIIASATGDRSPLPGSLNDLVARGGSTLPTVRKALSL